MPSASCDTDTSANKKHDQVAPHFSCLFLRNKISFSMPLAPCDPNTGTNGSTYAKSYISLHFDYCDLINAMVPLITALTSQRYVWTLFSHHGDISCLETLKIALEDCLVASLVWTLQMILHCWLSRPEPCSM